MAHESPAAGLADYLFTPPGDQQALFCDHQAHNRSGHIGHALAQLRNGDILAFYPDCSADAPSQHGIAGHSAIGWMEYRRSVDGGETWQAPQVLELSKRMLEQHQGRSLFTEKAVVTDNGTLVLFHLVCDITRDAIWEPYHVPLSSYSSDNGATWSEAVPVGGHRGRIYDALYHNGRIYLLKFRNDAEVNFCGNADEHVYEILVSDDDGKTFQSLSLLPTDTRGRGYGTLCALENGRIIAYLYNRNDEQRLDYLISEDGCLSWGRPGTAWFANYIRNPQMIAYGGGYFMHGRSGTYSPPARQGHFIIYFSRDGLHWDEGTILARRLHGQGAYSNSLVIRDRRGRERLRIHASHAYEQDKTNILYWWVDRRADGQGSPS